MAILQYCASGCALMLALGASPAARAASAPPAIDWLTYGGSPTRDNYNGMETVLSPANVPGLVEKWHLTLPDKLAFQPSLVRGVQTAGGRQDLLIESSPGGGVWAIAPQTGHIVWSATIKPRQISCGGAHATLGYGEPVTIDKANARGFVVDGNGMLHAYALATGTDMEGYPVQVIDSANLAAPSWVHYASPTLIGSLLYLTTAAVGQCENTSHHYHGQVIAFDTASRKIAARYYPMGNGAELGGGMWSAGGVVKDPESNLLWVSTGNGLPSPQNTGAAEKIIALDRALQVSSINGPVLPPGGDYDFGAAPLLYHPPSCPPMLAAVNKTGILVTYRRATMTNGVQQTIDISSHSGAPSYGMPAYDSANNIMLASSPADSANTAFRHGLIAFKLGGSCALSTLWQRQAGPNGAGNPGASPFIANGVVYFGEGTDQTIGAFNEQTGAPLWTSPMLQGPVKAPPLVVNGTLYAAGGNTLYAFGP